MNTVPQNTRRKPSRILVFFAGLLLWGVLSFGLFLVYNQFEVQKIFTNPNLYEMVSAEITDKKENCGRGEWNCIKYRFMWQSDGKWYSRSDELNRQNLWSIMNSKTWNCLLEGQNYISVKVDKNNPQINQPADENQGLAFLYCGVVILFLWLAITTSIVRIITGHYRRTA